MEDDTDDLFALKWALKKAEVTCPLRVAEDGREAVDYLAGVGEYADRKTYPLPHLVFLDLKLPYMTGFEVLSWVREHPDLKSLDVVVLSGSDEARDHKMANALGIVDYLVKPATPEQITEVLRPLDMV